jgi:Flp pilus assembly protein CpaB
MKADRILRAAAILALVSLGLIAWSILDPRPIPVIAAMSAGQGIGTLSLVAFLVVVATDLRRGDELEEVEELAKREG